VFGKSDTAKTTAKYVVKVNGISGAIRVATSVLAEHEPAWKETERWGETEEAVTPALVQVR